MPREVKDWELKKKREKAKRSTKMKRAYMVNSKVVEMESQRYWKFVSNGAEAGGDLTKIDSLVLLQKCGLQ